MYSTMAGMGKTATVKALADWTESIEKGAVPPAPPRPTGIERNIVSTQWDVGDDHSFMHDQVSTDKNHPNVNGGGPVYAVSAGHGQLVVIDPKENSTYTIDIPTREDKSKVSFQLTGAGQFCPCNARAHQRTFDRKARKVRKEHPGRRKQTL